MKIEIAECKVCPTTWIPDVYVNPSNNGNFQSSKYQEINDMIERTNEEFLIKLNHANKIAELGGKTKLKKVIEKRMKEGTDIAIISKSYELTVEQLEEVIN